MNYSQEKKMERMQLLDAIIELFEIGDTTLKQNIQSCQAVVKEEKD